MLCRWLKSHAVVVYCILLGLKTPLVTAMCWFSARSSPKARQSGPSLTLSNLIYNVAASIEVAELQLQSFASSR